MSNETQRWTSDHLFNQPTGVSVYSDQVRLEFRAIEDDFRTLRHQVHQYLKANPAAGDFSLQGRWHAWKVARKLRAMERKASGIVGNVNQFEATHSELYVELPKRRAVKQQVKDLQKAGRSELGVQAADSPSAQASQALSWADQPISVQPPMPRPAPNQAQAAPELPLDVVSFDLFGRAQ